MVLFLMKTWDFGGWVCVNYHLKKTLQPVEPIILG